MSDLEDDVNLSALGVIPVTPQTRQLLQVNGIQCPADLTEAGALALLELAVAEDETPECMGRHGEMRVCEACTVAAACERRTARPTPPPVPTRDPVVPRGPDADWHAMKALGFSRKQYELAKPDVRSTIIAEGIENRGVSITRYGELRRIPAKRKAPPPPPPRRRRS